ncbi:MAG: holo-ACP synthase [Thiobacillaceae bacterium]|jgi:holo-[acyl-carrier protein] synthase|nr:holo-ACP synthase [Thiobacillaceae bacterium]
MIQGIGTDLLNSSRIRSGLARFGEHYADRILAPAEHAGYYASRDPALYLAKCFAAKEALSKALGTGLRPPVTLRNIAVLRDPHGRPHFELAPPLAAWLESRGMRRHHVSLSDEGDMVLAFAIVESES